MNELIVRFYVNEKNKNILKAIISKLNLKNKDCFVIDINKNDEYDDNKAREFPDGFLYFSNFIEYLKDEAQYSNDDIYNSKLILKTLWNSGIPAIASCDFEEKLPKTGGYKSKDIPWWSKIYNYSRMVIWKLA